MIKSMFFWGLFIAITTSLILGCLKSAGVIALLDIWVVAPVIFMGCVAVAAFVTAFAMAIFEAFTGEY